MLFDEAHQRLYIFQGQRNGNYLRYVFDLKGKKIDRDHILSCSFRDSYVYDIRTDKVTEFRGKMLHGESLDPYQKGYGPPSSFTQRAAIDTQKQAHNFFKVSRSP